MIADVEPSCASAPDPERDVGALWAVMPTYRRPDQLTLTLAALAAQTLVPDHLVIVDNGGDAGPVVWAPETRGRSAAMRTVLLNPGSNTGPAGALATGLRHVLDHAGAEDLVVTLDDDDPPLFDDTLEALVRTARTLAGVDPHFGAVGSGGSRWDGRRNRLTRLRNDELTGGPVPVDVISGNHFPLMRVGVVEKVGPYLADLFYGFDDLEFFLRMRRSGWHVYCADDQLLRRRRAQGRDGSASLPSRRLGPPDWRRFYSIRNSVFIARRYAGPLAAARLVGRYVGKVLANAVIDPRAAAAHTSLTLRACRDGLRGRLGCPWPPELDGNGQLSSDNGRTVRRGTTGVDG